MKIENTLIDRVKLIKYDPYVDERGVFSRSFCKKIFEENKLESNFVQQNISKNNKANTLRGLHYQKGNHEEVKLVTCINGSIQDVIVDIDPTSKTFLKHVSINIDEESNVSIYIGVKCAHGFLTLKDNTIITYLTSNFYSKENEAGLLWNDQAFDINWQSLPNVISPKDISHKPFSL